VNARLGSGLAVAILITIGMAACEDRDVPEPMTGESIEGEGSHLDHQWHEDEDEHGPMHEEGRMDNMPEGMGSTMYQRPNALGEEPDERAP